MNSRNALTASLISAVRGVVGDGRKVLHEPVFGGNEYAYLKECIDTTFVSSVGKFVDRFEADLATYTGAKHAVAVVNGTAALHIALKLAGVKSEDEVLVPALTFVATANAVRYCGAYPNFVDSEERTLGIDAQKLRAYLTQTGEMRAGTCVNRSTGRVIRAIVPMHTFGHPSDLDGLLAVARDFNLAMVEDAAESIGSTYFGKHTGTFGLMGTLSFNGNKTMTTGGGGAILTDNPELAKYAKHLTTTAKIPHAWEFRHDEIGYNYRMPNLNAALGCAQLERLDDLIDRKRELYLRYRAAMSGIAGVTLVQEPTGCRSNYWLQALVLDPGHQDDRDFVLEQTNSHGLMTRPIWALMNDLPMYLDCPRMDLAVAASLVGRTVNIPSSSNLVAVAQ